MTRRIGLRIVCAASLFCAITSTTQSAHAQTYTTLYSFTGAGNGEYPIDNSHLLIDSKGDVYGTAPYTTEHELGKGIVFRLSSAGVFSVLDRFGANNPDGKDPYAGLTAGKDGNLYGTTAEGGPRGSGTIFELAPPKPGHAGWTETILHTFSHDGDGEGPSQLVMDGMGNLYGAAGGGDLGGGTVFKYSNSGVFTVLHYFNDGSQGETQGVNPEGVVLDPTGNIYGVTQVGGINSCGGEKGCGVVFQLTPSGQETVLYTFTGGSDGGWPLNVALNLRQRALYGVTYLGGDLSCSLFPSQGCGVLFKLDSSGETVLHTFTGEADGGFPGVIIADGAGNLYGSTAAGGDLSCNSTYGVGCGVLFKLDTSGNYSVLYTFGNADFPSGSIVGGLGFDSESNLYGVTYFGGDFTNCVTGCGTVFKLSNLPH